MKGGVKSLCGIRLGKEVLQNVKNLNFLMKFQNSFNGIRSQRKIYREQRVSRKGAVFQNVKRTASTSLKALNHLGAQKRKDHGRLLVNFFFSYYKLEPAF